MEEELFVLDTEMVPKYSYIGKYQSQPSIVIVMCVVCMSVPRLL